LLLGACSGSSPSTLDPAGFGARRVAGLWWLLFAVATVVCVVVIALVLLALRRRRAEPGPSTDGRRVVVVAGVLVPAVVLTAVYLVGLRDLSALDEPARTPDVTIDVTGHLWWWEVSYPDAGVVTANEIHVPVGRDVRLRLRTADVNHSFWVPQLTVKTDLVAGRVNTTWLRAERAGRFRGQCAEYCGAQHAHMALVVVAEPEAAFRSWAAQQAQDAPAPTTAAEQRGLEVLESASCASCHTVRGTTARGTVGPDLTHLATRSEIGAGTLPNDPGHLAGWIADAQSAKPGNRMPPQPLAPEDLRALVAYLDAGRARTASGTSGTDGGTG
jgi:cytochrome c oxidase subunit 2